MDVKVRKLKLSDLRQLAPIYVASFNALKVGEVWNQKSAYNLLKYMFENKSKIGFVALKDKTYVGATIGFIRPWCTGNVLVDAELFVDPKSQKQGIGKMLLEKLFHEALTKHKVKYFQSITFKNVKFPLSWYKSLEMVETPDMTLISGETATVLKKLTNNSKKKK